MTQTAWAGWQGGRAGFGSAQFGARQAGQAQETAKGPQQVAWGNKPNQAGGGVGGWGTKAQVPQATTQTTQTQGAAQTQGANRFGQTSAFGQRPGGFGGMYGQSGMFNRTGMMGNRFGGGAFGGGTNAFGQNTQQEVSVDIHTHTFKFEHYDEKGANEKTVWKIKHITMLPMYHSYTIEELRFNDYVKEGKLEPLHKQDGEADGASKEGGVFGSDQQSKGAKIEKWDWWKALTEAKTLPYKAEKALVEELRKLNPDKECYFFAKQDDQSTSRDTDTEGKGIKEKKIWHLKLKGFNRGKGKRQEKVQMM